MPEILRYMIVDEHDNEGLREYDSLDKAKNAAKFASDGGPENFAVIRCTYVYDDSELVWTPDGGDTWPPVED